MEPEKARSYVRRTISISPEVDNAIATLAEREFSGNSSAFIAHCILQYLACQSCKNNMAMQEGESQQEENPDT